MKSFFQLSKLFCTFIIFLKSVNTCHDLHTNFFQHFSSKTPYRYIANYNTSSIEYEGCKPWKIWLVQRHGTRTPGNELDKFVRDRLPKIQEDILNNLSKGELCSFEGIKLWTSHKELDSQKRLTSEGQDELFEFAERLQLRLPTLLDQPYQNTNFLFRYTDTQRTDESAKQFATGLFGRIEVKKVVFTKPLDKDPLLRFYKVCQKWRQNVKKSPSAILEYTKFTLSDIVNTTLSDLSKRLGLNYTLSFKEAKNIYSYCAFETAWEKIKVSPWCSIFSELDFKVFEYSEDLKHYLIDGDKYELTYKQACVLLKNVVEHFDDDKLDSHNGIFYFTHSGTVLKMLGVLGLYKDNDNLRHDNFWEMENRQWRTSKIDAFGSNLIFVLFKCYNDMKILTLHQEKIIRIPGCESDLCSYDTFKKIYQEKLNNCDFNKMCNIE
ncbi:multiple inositol polyphosphate phosphatase 1-like isoform X2 [Daktulosphaira vitifoliae]|uniref:multiple inositol polyphosphate phosphatase 1-like isoform X2 n=1 Tax=Daktulosphaira vitifoliae TaxID=58002 RepID=UPI0021AA1354|nr:multiple inositol polyphosphate phosphatase 1-like isoform X2 [Daktulosphaira vitifoliae]